MDMPLTILFIHCPEQAAGVCLTVIQIRPGQFQKKFLHRRDKNALLLQFINIDNMHAGPVPFRHLRTELSASEPGRFFNPDDDIVRDQGNTGLADFAGTSSPESLSEMPPATEPSSSLTRHLPQTPVPPQEALICRPAIHAALRTDVPLSTRT